MKKTTSRSVQQSWWHYKADVFFFSELNRSLKNFASGQLKIKKQKKKKTSGNFTFCWLFMRSDIVHRVPDTAHKTKTRVFKCGWWWWWCVLDTLTQDKTAHGSDKKGRGEDSAGLLERRRREKKEKKPISVLDNEIVSPRRQWTIIVYMYSDFNIPFGWTICASWAH